MHLPLYRHTKVAESNGGDRILTGSSHIAFLRMSCENVAKLAGNVTSQELHHYYTKSTLLRRMTVG